MADDIEIRRRKAVYRAEHRGTKEMDLMLGGYARATLPSLDGAELTRFEQFLALPDPELQGWLLGSSPVPGPAFAGLVATIRKFHGL